jgi:thiamine-monophosphate kinase
VAVLGALSSPAARPIGVLVSLALPEMDAGASAEQLMVGAGEAVARVGGIVLGGDVTRSPGPLLVDVTAVGEAARPVTRSGARSGDEVWVTGELGGSGAAVAAWLAGRAPDPAARERFAAPAPRTAEALWLAERGIPTAMLDLSDGLGGDAGHVVAASGVALVLDMDALPVHAAAQAGSGAEAIRLALRGGEDYELMFTARPGTVDPLRERFASRFDIPLTRVGRVEAGAGVYRQEGDAILPLTDGGFQHFEG